MKPVYCLILLYVLLCHICACNGWKFRRHLWPTPQQLHGSNRLSVRIGRPSALFMVPFDQAPEKPIVARIGPIDYGLDLPVVVQAINKKTVDIVKCVLNLVYDGRPYAKFAALETIARVPYFSYTSVLHLYETMGWMRRKEYIQIHFAESWNELHHLLIMEELGGNKLPFDRFVAQHIAFFYYWLVVLLYMISPAVAYDLNKHVELHAYNTYLAFIRENEAMLRSQPAPQVAKDYYQNGDLYMFDAFQYNEVFRKHQQPGPGEGEVAPPKSASYGRENSTIEGVQAAEGKLEKSISTNVGSVVMGNGENDQPRRRPVVETLYDVFQNICADEAEHAGTMRILQRDVCLRNRGDKRSS